MNYTDKDVQAIVDTQVELKTKELKQAFNEIREYVENNKHLNWYVESCHFKDILQIIDKYLGGSDE